MNTASRVEVVRMLAAAVRRLETCREFSPLVPEVRSNFAYSLPEPRLPTDVASVDGRITVVGGMPKASGPVRFGVSDHLARLHLEIAHLEPGYRSCINFRWNETILSGVTAFCERHSIQLAAVDRSAEPTELIGRDRSSMPWKVAELVRITKGRIPRVFYETRGWGKEPLFVLFGPDPATVVEEIMEIARMVAGIADR